MVYCESQLRLLFIQYNMDYFGDILPMPIFRSGIVLTYWGISHIGLTSRMERRRRSRFLTSMTINRTSFVIFWSTRWYTITYIIQGRI